MGLAKRPQKRLSCTLTWSNGALVVVAAEEPPAVPVGAAVLIREGMNRLGIKPRGIRLNRRETPKIAVSRMLI